MFRFITKKAITISILMFIILGGFSVAQNSEAAFNERINYQGKLTNTSGVAVADGVYDMVFKLYTAAGGGADIWNSGNGESWTDAVLWTETSIDFTEDDAVDCGGDDKIVYTDKLTESALAVGQYVWNIDKEESAVIKSVNTGSDFICVYDTYSVWDDGNDATNRIYVKDGLFSVMLGTITSLSSANFNQTLYLGVTIDADSEMKPRKALGAVPAAFEAKKLGGYTWVVPGTIGSTTPNTGAFTTLSSAYSGTSTALTVTQSGTGEIINITNTVSATSDAFALTNLGSGNSFVINDEASDTTPFVIDENGNVGIGTSNPGAKLEVVGNIKAGNNYVVRSFTKTVCASNSVETYQCDYLCDGTDDQTEINTAITVVNAAGGGTVKLMEGTYNVSNNVIVLSNIALSGNGWGTIIRLVNEATLSSAGILRAVGGASYFTIENLAVDGNKTNQTDGTNKYGFYGGENASPSQYVTLQNLYVHDCSRYGLDPHEITRYILIDGCTVKDNGDASNDYDGIVTDYIEHSVISNNIVTGNVRHGINIVTTSKYNTYTGNVCEGNGDNGITINGSSDNVITGNTCKGNSLNGIYLTGADNNTVIGNYVGYNQNNGIKLYKSSYNTITGNKLINNSQLTNNAYSEIILDDDAITYSTYNVVTGNSIICDETNKAKYGIAEDATGNNYNLISNNIAMGPVTADIFAQGPHTTVAGNKTSSATEGLFDISSNAGATQSALSVTQSGTGNIVNLKDGTNNTILSITNGGQTTFKPTSFDTVYNFDGVATYTDNTTEAKTSGGTAFTILALEASSNDEFYIGLDHPFNTVYFDIATAGAGVTLSAQYWNGAWATLSITADGTASLTTDGAVTFTAPSDWATTSVNGVTKYWVKLRSPATNITVAPTAYSVSPTTGNRFYVYGQSGDTNPALYINDNGNVGIGTSNPGAKLEVVGNIKAGNNYVVRSFTKTVCASNSVETYQCDYLCDGTDDQTEINTAITVVNAAGGGTVKLMEGTFLTGDNITVKASVNLQGNGTGTIVKLEDEAILSSAGIIRMKHTTRVANASIKNLTIDGNRVNQTDITNKYGIYAEGDHLLIENNHIKDVSGYGVDPHEDIGGNPSTYVYTTNNLIENCGSLTNLSAAITYDKNYNGVIANNTVIDSPYHGISIVTDSKNLAIYGNQVKTTIAGHGVQITGGTDITIANNNVDDAGDDGIYVSGTGNSERITIVGNNITNSFDRGIRIYKSSHNIISNNNLYHNSSSGGDDEIILDDDGVVYSTYNIVSGNRILADNARYGIREDAVGNDHNVITGNIVTGAVTGNISSQGVNSVVAGNKTSSVTEGLFNISSNTGATQDNLKIINAGTGNSLSIDQNGNVGTAITTDGAMFIENTGNIGIGLNSYTNLGATADAGLVYFTADNTGFDQTVLTVKQDGTGDVVNFYDGVTEVFTILDGGNVGIGTATPQDKLDIRGDILSPIQDVTVDCDGSATTTAGACDTISDGATLVVMGDDTMDFDNNAVADAVYLCADSLTLPAHVRVDLNQDCTDNAGTDGTYILGSTAATIKVTSAWAFKDDDADTLLDNGEDLYIDKVPAIQYFSSGTGNAVFGGDVYAGTRSGGAIDVAEWIRTGDSNIDDQGKTMLEAGDVICTDREEPNKVIACQTSYDNIISVVSTNPHLTMGEEYKGEDAVRMVLAGRVPVKVSLENGPIEMGDYLTSSSVSGIAMKATKPGRIIGTALESFNGSEIMDQKLEANKAMVLINPGFSLGSLNSNGSLDIGNEDINDSDNQTETEQLTVSDQFTLAVKNALEKLGLIVGDGIASVKELVTDKITTRELNTDELCIQENGENICINGSQLKELLERTQIRPSTMPFIEPGIAEPTKSVDVLVCDSDHLDLCNTKDLCGENNLYWYDDICNIEVEQSKDDLPVEQADSGKNTDLSDE